MTFVNARAHDASAQQPPRTSEVQRLLGNCRPLRGLPQAVLSEMAGQASVARHADGEMLFYEGDPARHCLLVAQGAVALLRHDERGEERLWQCFGTGALVAEAAMFLPGGLHPLSARAQGAVRVWQIPGQALRAACLAYPELALRMLQCLSQCLHQRVNEVDWLTRGNTQERLASYVLAQAMQQGTCIELPCSQRHLAARLGVRAETLSRLLAQWRARGWVQGRGRHWRLCDRGALQRLAPSGAHPF